MAKTAIDIALMGNVTDFCVTEELSLDIALLRHLTDTSCLPLFLPLLFLFLESFLDPKEQECSPVNREDPFMFLLLTAHVFHLFHGLIDHRASQLPDNH